jgi:hypothetical protein
MGYDCDGKEVFGIGVKTKNVVAWARRNVTQRERRHLIDQYNRYLSEESCL